MRKFLDRLLAPLGYSVIRKRNIHNELNALIHAFTLLKPDLVIDVGANNGQFYNLCRKAGYNGMIWCVEPSPSQYENIQTLLSDDVNSQCFNYGISDKAGILKLSVSGKIGDLSSFLNQNKLYEERFRSGSTTCEVDVEVINLERLIKSEQTKKYKKIFLKTDTQGMDLKVIKSLGSFLKDNSLVAIKSEMSVKQIYDESSTHWEILDLIKSLRLEPLYFEHISRMDNYELIEYDAIFTRPII